MNTYTAHMVPHCFGRYLIDLPADMKVGKMASATFAVFPYSEYSGAIEVKITPMSHATFEHALGERKAVLKAKRVVGHTQWAALGSTTSLPNDEGVILNWANGMTRSTRRLELHGWKNGYAIKMGIDALDESFPEDKNDPPELKSGADLSQKLAILQSLYARTSGRPDGEIPSQPGTCIQNGFISGPASDKITESISIDFVSKSMPDVNFSLQSNSGIRGTSTLLDRLSDIEASLKAAKGHFIRKGHRRTNPEGMSYDEILMTAMTPNDHVMGQYFTLEANSKKGSAETPLLNIDFFNGDRESPAVPAEDDLVRTPPLKLSPLSKASLSEAEAVVLWDKAVATLRPRPGAF